MTAPGLWQAEEEGRSLGATFCHCPGQCVCLSQRQLQQGDLGVASGSGVQGPKASGRAGAGWWAVSLRLPLAVVVSNDTIFHSAVSASRPGSEAPGIHRAITSSSAGRELLWGLCRFAFHRKRSFTRISRPNISTSPLRGDGWDRDRV